jgi:F420-dependent oxidoreductase-like protein
MSSEKKVRFGIQTPQEGATYAALKAHWQEAEKLGYDSIWLDDHFFSVATARTDDQLECWTTLAGLAEATSKIRFGALVTCNSFRQPSLLAKISSAVDVISGGRLEFGFGAGWFEAEHIAYGFPFPKPSERMAKADEALQIIKKMWTEESPSFEGRYYTIKDAVNQPKPVQKPHPPIWIGGTGEKLLLRLVAKYANVWNTGLSPADYKQKIQVLNEHCAAVGRDPNEIEKTWFGQTIVYDDPVKGRQRVEARAQRQGVSVEEFSKRVLWGTTEECIEKLNQWVDVGVTHFIFMFGRVDDLRSTRLFAEKVMPAFK